MGGGLLHINQQDYGGWGQWHSGWGSCAEQTLTQVMTSWRKTNSRYPLIHQCFLIITEGGDGTTHLDSSDSVSNDLKEGKEEREATEPSSKLAQRRKKKQPHIGLLFPRKTSVSTHPQLSVFGTEGKWRIFRKSRNIFGRTPFSIIIVWQNKSKLQSAQKATRVKRSARNSLWWAVHWPGGSVDRQTGRKGAVRGGVSAHLQVELQTLPPLLQHFGNPVSDVLWRHLRRLYALL